MDASETFRAELERIGSLSSNQGSPKVQTGQPMERPSAALSPPQAPMQPLERPPSLTLSPPKAAQPLPQPLPQTVPRRPSVGSPLSQPARKTSDSIPPLNLAPVAGRKQVILSNPSLLVSRVTECDLTYISAHRPCMCALLFNPIPVQGGNPGKAWHYRVKSLHKGKTLRLVQVHVAGKGAVKEQELISWDEVKDEKDVYQAVRTADGRQALVRAGGVPKPPCRQFWRIITSY